MKNYFLLLLASSSVAYACQKALSINNQALQEEPQESVQELNDQLKQQIEKNLALATHIAQLPLSSDDEEEFCELLQKQAQICSNLREQLEDLFQEIREYKLNAGRDQAAHSKDDMDTSSGR